MTTVLRMATVALGVLLAGGGLAAADSAQDCFSDSNDRRISGCSALLDLPGLDDGTRSIAYAMRALAYSLRGQYPLALPDYDEAIRLDPYSAVALNNRAWALLRTGRAEQGLPDVERSLEVSPASPHAHDTRAHIRQAMGDANRALADYEYAIRYGGERIVKLYQCGLQGAGHYNGPIDGFYTSDTRRALQSCVRDRTCDPLPPSEDCGHITS